MFNIHVEDNNIQTSKQKRLLKLYEKTISSVCIFMYFNTFFDSEPSLTLKVKTFKLVIRNLNC